MTYYGTTDFNNDNYSYSDDSSSICSDQKKHKEELQKMKKLDPGFFIINRYKYSEKFKKMKPTKVELYRSSGIPDHKIRNAVTGFYEKLRVGRFESDLLFKVILATGETGNIPEQLYFDSPEQYEKHCNVIVSDSVKKAWKQKYDDELEYQMKRKSTESKTNMCIC